MTTTVVTFDRIGRNHEPPPLTVESTDSEVIRDAVYTHARPHLASRDVWVTVDGAEVTIFAGFHVAGTGKVTVAE